jgi:hypothetical protein
MTKDQAAGAAQKALNWAHETYPQVSQGKRIKVALLRFILDEAGVKRGSDERKAACAAFMATPTWFGASANSLTTTGIVAKGAERDAEAESMDA